MFAVIKTGGKQYKVIENQVLKVEKLAGEVGEKIKFESVLSLNDGKKITIGEPLIEGACVSAEVIDQKKDKKVIIFKKKRRQGYKRKLGHRQRVTFVRILDVSGKGENKVIKAKSEETKEVKASEAKSEEK